MFGNYNPFHVRNCGFDHMHGVPITARMTLGEVFVNGKRYLERWSLSECESIEESWYHEEITDVLYINFPDSMNPAEQLIEINARERIFVPKKRNLGYITVKGFIIEHAGNQFNRGFWVNVANKQAGALGTHSGHHWIIENNVIRYAKSIGLDCGSETAQAIDGQPKPPITSVGYHLIKNNVISDNGSCGIAGYNHYNTQIINNRIERNNYCYQTKPEAGGIKVHGFINGLIANNLLIDNDCWGIWLDNGYTNARVTRNIVLNSRGSGIFVELGWGPVLVDNNVVAFSREEFYEPDPKGDGIYCHDASGATIAHNLVFDNHGFGIMMRVVTDRYPEGQLCECSNMRIVNNILNNNGQGNICIPYPGSRARSNISDANAFDPDGLFVLSTYGGTGIDNIRYFFDRACPGDSFTIWPDRAENSVHSGVELTFSQWQKLGKYDIHGLPVDLQEFTLSKETLFLQFSNGKDLENIQCQKVARLDYDFFGNPLPSDPIPGPFQNLINGMLAISIEQPDNVVQVEEKTIAQNIPEWFELFQNYPNPFNSSTNILYELSEASPIQMEIYNILGQKIKILLNDVCTPGQHRVIWDGTDEQGKKVASGLYLCHIYAGDSRGIIKMLLLN